MFITSNRKRQAIINNLLNVSNDSKIYKKLLKLQNDLFLETQSKVIAIVSVDDDYLSASFAKAFYDTYSINGNNAYVIDANLYNPCLLSIISKNNNAGKESSGMPGYLSTSPNNDKLSRFIEIKKDIYPGKTFKDGGLQKIIDEHSRSADNLIIIFPSIKEHKEIALLAEKIDYIFLICQQNVTTKNDIYNSIKFLEYNSLPFTKTIILK